MKRVALAGALLALTGLSGCVSGYFTGMTKELQEHGVAAEATILKVWDTGWTVNNDPVIGMRVEVRPREGSAYEATIGKTMISRIDLPQFQPGKVIPVRYDPANRAAVAVDFEGEAASAETSGSAGLGSGNPYRDRFARAPEGSGFLPPPAVPEVYLGTADSAADEVALIENGYASIGRSIVEGGSDLQPAIEQGKAVGAALIVLYGHFEPPAGTVLAVLPLRPRAGHGAGPAEQSFVPELGAGDHVALYLGKSRPPILGASLRALNGGERTRWKLDRGAVVLAVAAGSPAEAARLEAGDVLLAVDGKPVGDVTTVPGLVRAAAGRTVKLDLLREGAPFSLEVRLNPASP